MIGGWWLGHVVGGWWLVNGGELPDQELMVTIDRESSFIKHVIHQLGAILLMWVGHDQPSQKSWVGEHPNKGS